MQLKFLIIRKGSKKMIIYLVHDFWNDLCISQRSQSIEDDQKPVCSVSINHRKH